MTEKLLQTLVDTGSEHAIIDITGVPAVDTQVAQHLLKTVVAARLMGAECIISGIRPQIAQTIVALGIEFGDVATKATLADALRAGVAQERRRRCPAATVMDRVPILKLGDILLVSIQIDLEDQIRPGLAGRPRPSESSATGAKGVLIDISASRSSTASSAGCCRRSRRSRGYSTPRRSWSACARRWRSRSSNSGCRSAACAPRSTSRRGMRMLAADVPPIDARAATDVEVE